MVWQIDYTEDAIDDLSKLDRSVVLRIRSFLNDRVAKLENPRTIGEALKGSNLGSFWRYRVGDYRILCSIADDVMRVLIVRAGHRKNVYDK